MNYPEIIPDTLFHYSVNELYNILSGYSNIDGNNYIHASYLFDIVYPTIYSIMLFILLSLLVKKLKIDNFIRNIRFIPFISFFSDILENNLVIYNIKHIDTFNNVLAQITCVLTTVKWSFVYLSLFMIIFLYVFSKSKDFKQKKR
ncbi:MAG: hypothetical protein U9Q83_10870 [Bacteroidota bacterium]|nr:hypothetical protein [Bacteroidota bacterium]